MAITQTLSSLPQAGKRGVQTRNAFVAAQEAFQDALSGVFVTEANTLSSQINTVADEVNTNQLLAKSYKDAASTSAGLAETYKNSAASTYTEFRTVYLGVFSEAPTTDNQGNALASGALYFDSTDDAMKIYIGGTWHLAYADIAGALTKEGNLYGISSATAARQNIQAAYLHGSSGLNFDAAHLTAAVITETSDRRVKDNIVPIDGALDKVCNMKGVEYTKVDSDTKEIGLIAQDVEEILPEVVSTDAEGMKSVSYARLVAVLIEAVKEQQQQINELKGAING